MILFIILIAIFVITLYIFEPSYKNMICEGVTKAGSKCKKPRRKGFEFCHLHMTSTVSTKPESTSDNQCLPTKPKYSIKNVAGDGYCFWRALSVCLTGSEIRYMSYLETCLTTKSSSDIISNTWVEFHEIPVISRLLGVSIAVYFYPRDIKRILNIDLTKDKGLFVYKCSGSGDIDTGPFVDERQLVDVDANIIFVPGHYMAIVEHRIDGDVQEGLSFDEHTVL